MSPRSAREQPDRQNAVGREERARFSSMAAGKEEKRLWRIPIGAVLHSLFCNINRRRGNSLSGDCERIKSGAAT